MSTDVKEEPLHLAEISDTRVTLLGTAHVSKASAEKVRELLNSGDYDAVAIELCPSRHNAMIDPDALAKMDLLQVMKKGQVAMVTASLALGAFQQRLAEEVGIEPGAEMRVALDIADESGLPVLLIDREIGTTLKRIYRNVPFWRRMGLISGLVASVVSREKVSEQEIERLKEGDMLETAFAEIAQHESDIFKPLIDERDRYMVARLQQQISDSHYQHVLAVVGAGHLKGMKTYLEEHEISDAPATIASLDAVPEASQWPKFIPWIVVVLILTGFFIGFLRSPDLGLELVIDWVVINGTLAALGALIAAAHPITIIAAFFAAPITSLNPTISAGLVTAAVETYVRKPQVGDFMRLRKDTAHFTGWWRNRVSRILLIFILATVGSAAGTYIAGFRIFEKLTN
ncbi:MAG: TraB/GumN family protein [Gammaproteobacteria bacterium]|nr:TraB/GumN family protein [Gammaproteobacteria bacterium]